MEFLISALVLAVVLTLITAYMQFTRKRKMLLEGFDVIDKEVDGLSFTKQNSIYDILAKKGEVTYLFKFIYAMGKNTELSINSKNYFQLNQGAVASKSQGSKLEKVYDLMNFDAKKLFKDGKVVKIYVVCPFAVNLIKVINECEVEKITPSLDVHGCRFINLNELEVGLKEIIKEDF